MEAYYIEDARLKEWVDQIIEKLFTVCLLSGRDADLEFARGLQAVEKIALALQKVSDLPSAALYEGLQQMLEQRLPDPRITDNFPMFKEIMEKMINEGIMQSNNSRVDDKHFGELGTNLVPKENEADVPDNDKFVQPDLALAESPCTEIATNEDISDSMPTQERIVAKISSPYYFAAENRQMRHSRQSEIPVQANTLSFLLKEFYPQGTVRWNLTLSKYLFLAQINDLLIYLKKDIDASKVIADMGKEGWKVLVLVEDDLIYRHRLERMLRSVEKARGIKMQVAKKNTII